MELFSTKECDDGNTDDGDGCSNMCTVESGWTCHSEDGDPSTWHTVWGDGIIIDEYEEWDDDNTDGGDGCSSSCDVEDDYTCTGEPSVWGSCGNEIIDGVEECDDGNALSNDGWSSTCTTETNYKWTGEPSSWVINLQSDPVDVAIGKVLQTTVGFGKYYRLWTLFRSINASVDIYINRAITLRHLGNGQFAPAYQIYDFIYSFLPKDPDLDTILYWNREFWQFLLLVSFSVALQSKQAELLRNNRLSLLLSEYLIEGNHHKLRRYVCLHIFVAFFPILNLLAQQIR